MGREVRMVPADWQHPKYPDSHHEVRWRGTFIPMHGRSYASAAAEWDEEWSQWQKGLRRNYGTDQWEPIDPEYAGMRYTEYAGARPSPDDYMPDWPAAQRTHYMMYEDTSEGTSISPAFATPEELARWLADTGASAFGDMTASYEAWLSTIKRGFAPSMVMQGGTLDSGVAALAEETTHV